MRTIFTIQGAGSRAAFLGQGSGTDQISETERNRLLNDLADAGEKLRAMNAWIDSHPNAQAALGADFQAYQDASGNMSRFGSIAATVQQRLASSDPAFWTVTAQQWNDTQNWIQFVTQIYGIIQRHGGTPAVPGASRGLLPGVSTPGTTAGISTPLLVAGGVGVAVIIGALLLK